MQAVRSGGATDLWRTERRVATQAALLKYTDRLHRAGAREEVLEASLDAIGEALECERASILLFDDESVMRFVAWRGLSDEYRAVAEGHSPWTAGQETAEPIAIEDAREADFDETLQARLAAEGIKSLAFIPLLSSRGVTGKFMMYFAEPHFYAPEELDVAIAVARHMEFALARVQAETQLRESEARYRAMARDSQLLSAVVQSSTDAIVSKDLNSIIQSWNGGAEHLFGYTAEEAIGQRVEMLFPPGREHEEEGILARIRAGERVENFDTVRMHKDGHLIDVSLTISPIRTPDGKIIGASKIARDVTERKNAEDALRESEARFRTMADHAPVMVWVTEADSTCTYLSKSWYEFTGQTPETGLGHGWLDAVHPDDREESGRIFTDANSRGEAFNLEYRLRRADGVYRWAIDSAQPRRAADGRFLGYIGSVIDITDRKRIEERLRRSEEEFRSMAENISQLAWMMQPDGWIYWYNKRWFDYTGTNLEQMEGWGWQAVHHPEHVDRVTEKFRRHIEAGDAWEDTFPLRGVDGEYRWFLSRAMPIRNGDGEVRRWFGTNTDITEQKRAEEQRTLLINELNHRVKNTLATVQSLASQTLGSATDFQSARKQFESRLQALARAHDTLTAQNWKGATLRKTVERAVEPFNESDRIAIDGPDVWLTPKQTLAFSLALHELGTNAMKYGALSGEQGNVQIAWALLDQDDKPDQMLEIDWREEGGPAVSPPEKPGFGARLIRRGVGRDLGADAELEFRPEGVRAKLRSPLEKLTSPAFAGTIHGDGA